MGVSTVSGVSGTDTSSPPCLSASSRATLLTISPFTAVRAKMLTGLGRLMGAGLSHCALSTRDGSLLSDNGSQGRIPVSNPAKARGSQFERDAARFFFLERAYGAGRLKD